MMGWLLVLVLYVAVLLVGWNIIRRRSRKIQEESGYSWADTPYPQPPAPDAADEQSPQPPPPVQE
jgi:hypothetical protein